MTVNYEPDAWATIDDIVDFIDSINTEGSGRFWLTNFLKHVQSYAKPNVKYSLCNNQVFAEEGLSCITYNGWVVAFNIEDDEMVVHYIVRGNILA